MFQSWCLGLLNFGHHWHISLSVRGNWQKRSKTSCLSQLVFSVCQLNTNNFLNSELPDHDLLNSIINKYHQLDTEKANRSFEFFYKYSDFSNLFFWSSFIISFMVNWHLFDPLQSKFDLILVKNVLIDRLMKMSKQTAKHLESGTSELLRSCFQTKVADW